MNRSQQVLEVYRELKRSVGAHIASSEILTCAASIVELFAGSAVGPQFDLRVGSMPFDSWSLDIALADGGWRVLARESDDCGDYEVEDEDERFQRLMRNFKGRTLS